MLGCISLLLGLSYGLLLSYILKNVRSMTKSPVAESALIFSFAYLSYVTAEIWHQSGIITLLTSGVTMAHYAWFSLSPQGKATSTIVFQQKTLESGFLDQSDRSILQMQMMLDEIRSAKEAEAKEAGVEMRTTPQFGAEDSLELD